MLGAQIFRNVKAYQENILNIIKLFSVVFDADIEIMYFEHGGVTMPEFDVSTSHYV